MKTQEITPRQLEAILSGLRNESKEKISRHMVVSPNTVKSHLSEARRSTGESNRVDLFLHCANKHLIDDNTLRSLVTTDEIMRINLLSTREREVANQLLVTGHNSNKSIADRLTMSVETAKKHMGNIFTKFGIHNRLRIAVIMYVGTKLPPNPTVRR